jgi:hypothetical protein
LEKNTKNINFFGPQFNENIEKSTTFDPSLGRRKFFLGRGLATPAIDI